MGRIHLGIHRNENKYTGNGINNGIYMPYKYKYKFVCYLYEMRPTLI